MNDESLRYPIGRFERPANVTDASRAECIAQLAAIPAQLHAAVHGLDDAQQHTPYRDGGWTVRQVVYHLGDSHLNCLARLMLGLTEEAPVIRVYDESAWVQVGDAAGDTMDEALEFITVLHARLVRVARTVTTTTGARTIVHPENGPLSIDVLLALYAWHGAHHVAHIAGLRARRGW
jgi:uncharacterized damage-inducible protein DinB